VADLAVLLDQNVPRAVAGWRRGERPHWTVVHAAEAGLARASDLEIFGWAQTRGMVVITFDEDFADRVPSPSSSTRAWCASGSGRRPSRRLKRPSHACSAMSTTMTCAGPS
jgi:hypothetical protein